MSRITTGTLDSPPGGRTKTLGLASRDPNLDRSRQPDSISSFLSSTRDSLVSRIPSLVIKFHIYKKKIIISKHISPPGGEPNLTTKLFKQVLLVQEKGSFDRDNSICRSPDSTPAYMTSWDFISITDSIYHNSHIKNNYFFETNQPSPIDFRPPQPTPSPSAPDQSPSPQWIRMTRPDIHLHQGSNRITSIINRIPKAWI